MAKIEREKTFRQKKTQSPDDQFLEDVRLGRNDPVHFATHVLGLKLHDGQKYWLRESIKDGRKKNILVPSNQYGKTFVTAVKHIWHCFYKIKLSGDPKHIKGAEYPTLNISPVGQQAKTMFSYVQQIVLGEFFWQDEEGSHVNDACKIKDFIKSKHENPVATIRYNNNSWSQFRSTHDDKARGLAGGQYAFISYDEAPTSYALKDELGANILSRLIKFNGDLDLVGTPDETSISNQFYMHLVKKALKNEDGWYAQIGKLDDNVFLPKKHRDDLKKAIFTTDKEKYRQVVFGEFITGGNRYFTPGQVESFFKEELKYEEPKPGHHYVLAADWAISGADYSVFVVIDYTEQPFRIVHMTRFPGSDYSPQEQYAVARSLQRKYGGAEFITDSTGLGGAIVSSELSDIVTSAFRFDRSLKDEALLALKELLASGQLVSPYNPDIEEELGIYKRDDKKLVQDIVMALAMASWYIKENYTDDVSTFSMDIYSGRV